MNHVIVTRCKFSKDDLFEKYFEVMKQYFIPSINNQTDKNFKLALIVNKKHYEQIKNLIDKKIEVLSFDDTKKDYKEYVVNNNINIQTRHDCDDLMLPNYVEKIHKLYEENREKHDDFILNFQPTKILVNEKKEYTHSRDYSKVCSMFSTLIQKNVKHGIMDIVHDHLVRLCKNVIYIPETYVKLCIHGNNTTSKLTEKDKFIDYIK